MRKTFKLIAEPWFQKAEMVRMPHVMEIAQLTLETYSNQYSYNSFGNSSRTVFKFWIIFCLPSTTYMYTLNRTSSNRRNKIQTCKIRVTVIILHGYDNK